MRTALKLTNRRGIAGFIDKGLAGALATAIAIASAAADDVRRLDARGFMAQLRATGELTGPAIVDDDIDLTQLAAPDNAVTSTILLRDVRFRGRLHGAPKVPIRMVGGVVCRLEAQGADFDRTVDLQGVAVGSLRLRLANLRAPWTCFDCRLCRVNLVEANFSEAATFTGSVFGTPLADGLCRPPVGRSCGDTDFAEATFAGPARFDLTTFRSKASFDSAEFRDTARFTRSTSTSEISLIGARFRRDAEFRECTLADAHFGPTSDIQWPTSIQATEFASRADFRGCRFTGAARFDGAVFTGDALFSRARFVGSPVSFLGVLGSRPLDLRGAIMERPDATLELDATASDVIRLDWDALGSSVLRGLPRLPPEQRIATLDTLSRQLKDAGQNRAALRVGFEAMRVRREDEPLCADDSVGSCAAGEAEWWLWTLPTRNGSDLTGPLAVLAVLWGATAIAGLSRGRVLTPPAGRKDGEPVYDCLPAPEFPEGTWCALGPRRAGEAVGFATGLVLKLGSRRQRLAAPLSSNLRLATNLTLRLIWLLGWVMIALAAGVVGASFPGLRALAP